MSKRKNPFIDIGFEQYQGIHLMPFSLRDRAERHERNRQRVVASILLDLYLMALSGYIKADARLVLKGAVTQTLEGSGVERTAAAHCVPRQLIIDTRTPQDILASPYTENTKIMPERAFALSVLFGETDILPVNFNTCDSRAERYGLNDAFLKSCRYIIATAHSTGELEANSILMVIKNAFTIYKYEAERAFKISTERLREKLVPRFIFPADKAKWTEQLQITEKYAETLQESQTVIELLTLQRIEGLMRVYAAENSE